MSLFQKIFHLHWFLILLIIIGASIGFAMLYSAAEGHWYPWAYKQMIRFGALFPLMLMIALVDIRVLLKYSYVGYVATLLLLLWVEFAGYTAMGATRWVKIGSFVIQPSEVMKISVILVLARYFHSLSVEEVGNTRYLVIPLLLILLPFALILRQPDLGTALIILMLGGAMFFAAGVKIWKFATIIGAGVLSLPLIWNLLHDYQKQRIFTFLNPESDPLGAGYNIIQSKIAIGSGGMTGKGFLKGTQSQLSFLPEKQTDFIFTMLSEEFGFFGGIGVLGLYIVIIGLSIVIAIRCSSHYGRMLASGITSLIFLHVIVNMAMVMGLIPVVGAPLPLLSYGGTILATVMIGFGLLLNVHIHSDEKIERNVGGI